MALARSATRPKAIQQEDAMDLSLGTPGLISKLPPSVKDVKDLCFGTFPSANLPLKYSPVGSYEKQQQPIRYVYPEEENTSEDEDDKDEGGKANFPFSIFMRLPYVVKDKFMNYDSPLNFKDKGIRKMVRAWVDTWKNLDKSLTWIHVHAYYSKKKRHGGYGVILRDAHGKPVIAKAKFSKRGDSFLCQVFRGISAGVSLAEEHKLSNLHVHCNSFIAPYIFRKVRFCCENKCKNANDRTDICKKCEIYFIVSRCDMLPVLPLVLNLRHKNLGELLGSTDLAAHYVAKMEKKKILEAMKREEGIAKAYDGSVIKSGGFPGGLKNILWLGKDVLTHDSWQLECF